MTKAQGAGMQDYMDADYEVISMVNRRKDREGLPGKVIHFIPEERAPAVLALDERIQDLKRIAHFAAIGAAFLIGLLM